MKKEKEDNNCKKESGITLIALIVTIILMLTLAGITIKLAISDNGIIDNAKEAKDQYEESQVNGEKETTELSDYMKNNLGRIRTGAIVNDKIEVVKHKHTKDLTNSKIELDWDTLVEVANIISEDEDITSDASQVIMNVRGKQVTLTVGDYTSLKYDGVDKKVRLIGFNHDDLASGNGKAGMTFEFITTLGTDVLDSDNDITTKGWEKWTLRTKMPEYLSKIEDVVKNNIKPVIKKYGVGINSASGIDSCTDSLWLLSGKEISVDTWESGDDGDLYKYYAVGKENKTDSSELYSRYTLYSKEEDKSSGDLQNSGDKWNHVCAWLRSVGDPYSWSHTTIEYIDGEWRLNSNCYGTSKFYVAPAFCIGGK